MVAGDVDGDGHEDVLVGQPIVPLEDAGFSVALGPIGPLGVAPCGRVRGVTSQSTEGLGDLDGDGFGDFVVLREDSYGDLRWGILLGPVTGTLDAMSMPFYELTGYAMGDLPTDNIWAHRAGDFDHDGTGDVVLTRNSVLPSEHLPYEQAFPDTTIGLISIVSGSDLPGF